VPASRSLSLAEARRIVLAAQGFAEPRPEGQASKGDLRRMIERLGVVQIDSVNVLARAHTLPAFSRLGCYRPADLDALAYGPRRALFEYWGHEASLLPVALQPLLRWRMHRAARGEGIYRELARFAQRRRALIGEVRRELEDRGPLAARELSREVGANAARGGWWGWSDAKRALEWLFWTGAVSTATRRGTFERVYDLTERVLPRAIIAAPTPSEADAQRALLRIAARALGVATERCLRDYFRIGAREAKARIDELVEAGELIAVAVDGWSSRAYLDSAVKRAPTIAARALLAPFDPLIWQRERAEAVFGARIRLEIYTPRRKRAFGYYVLPLLLGERIAARVDLKADRKRGALLVAAAHAEPAVDRAEIVLPLAAELRLIAAWLSLARIRVGRRGDLSAPLALALKGEKSNSAASGS
jgi:uncharacterized protein YcaQ